MRLGALKLLISSIVKTKLFDQTWVEGFMIRSWEYESNTRQLTVSPLHLCLYLVPPSFPFPLGKCGLLALHICANHPADLILHFELVLSASFYTQVPKWPLHLAFLDTIISYSHPYFLPSQQFHSSRPPHRSAWLFIFPAGPRHLKNRCYNCLVYSTSEPPTVSGTQELLNKYLLCESMDDCSLRLTSYLIFVTISCFYPSKNILVTFSS